ncbi:hypothetical protein XFF6166_440069 [Xanthomonas citri pv. fuscans]|uniref:Uncharacterized protein n=1 Tax=Xanthomonas citri pv. citri TaxID=611301 RepID=A0A0U5FJU0_XANCI|nr:hypothetical protein XAC3824_660071 [Xanthomonas citri pv. citri]CEJ45392.1 hypothetical protein XAB3213_3010010 [Xanthomonas citri pv. bilvae]SON80152.1 hypothetical protein XFF6166_440069 [Xanthomonas citri pv. fuscans]CEE31793.1 hypothetical protein XAC1083_510071 [Xanthomonas citri pv. citri]CEE41174.1 hypothetical protein XAC3810_510073 [Xanthomonas citri pv. citri]
MSRFAGVACIDRAHQANGPLTPAAPLPCPDVAPAATLPAFPLYCLRCRSLILVCAHGLSWPWWR